MVGQRGSEHSISHGHVVEANRKQFVGHPSHAHDPSVARGAHVMVISLLAGCAVINVVSEVGVTPPSTAPASVMTPGDGGRGYLRICIFIPGMIFSQDTAVSTSVSLAWIRILLMALHSHQLGIK